MTTGSVLPAGRTESVRPCWTALLIQPLLIQPVLIQPLLIQPVLSQPVLSQ